MITWKAIWPELPSNVNNITTKREFLLKLIVLPLINILLVCVQTIKIILTKTETKSQ